MMRISQTLLAGALAACLVGAATPAISVTQSSQLRWSDPSTWGGAVPRAGDHVVIPAGKTILLDVSPPSLAGLEVAGTLTFARKDLDLTADWIMIHGTLRVGTKDRPFRDRATITLTGRSGDVMGMGTRVLGVMGGTLDLHGSPTRGWVRLADTADKGATKLRLTSVPGWKIGDRIAIASTDYSADHAEERTVTAVHGDSVTIDKPLEWQHWGIKQEYAGTVVDERAEVGLLSRNVVVQGAADSTSDAFGAHTMFEDGSRVRVEGVEFRRVGQIAALRRYPIHFHTIGNASTSYLRRSVVHHSFNRCVVVHGTNRLKIQGNVCYDHIGHGFFLEDGAETDNRFTGNLGLMTRAPIDPLLPSEEDPSTYWITNPDNILRGNVAAGSEGIGFWYALPEHPLGLSEDESVWPRRTPLGVFAGNVAHSNGSAGLNVDDGPRADGSTETAYYRPLTDPSDEDSDAVVASFKNFVSYKNRDRGVWLRGENHVVEGAVLADNRVGATFASSETYLQDSLAVGETANKGNPESWEETGLDGRSLPTPWRPDAPIVGFEFYDGMVGARRVTFANFQPNSQRESGGLGYLEPDPFSIHPQNFATEIRFTDSERVHLASPVAGKDGDASKVFVDRDGSVTGSAGSVVVVDNPFLLDGTCEAQPAWGAHICHADYASLVVGIEEGDSAAIKPVRLTRSDGLLQTLVGCCDDSTYALSTILTRRDYSVEFNGGTPSDVRFVLWRGRGRWLRLTLSRTAGFEVTRWGYPIDEVDGSAALDTSPESAYYYDSTAGLLHLKIVAPDNDYEEIRISPP